MVPELQKPRITEIHVRMDCNGCVQKIKKALSGISGIYDLYIDFPQQKITIIGWADQEKIVKAIKKTRKIATICNIEPIEPPPSQQQEQQAEAEPSSSQQTEPEPEANNAKAPEQPEAETQPHHPTQEDHSTAQEEPPKDAPPPQEEENNACQQHPPPTSTTGTRDVGEVHVVHHQHPPNYGNRYGFSHSYAGQLDNRYRYHSRPVFPPDPPQPVHVTHSYNSYMPSPYVTEYEHVRSPPRHTCYNRMEYCSGDYHYINGNGSGNGNGNGNITSMFSDENPNACRIV